MDPKEPESGKPSVFQRLYLDEEARKKLADLARIGDGAHSRFVDYATTAIVGANAIVFNVFQRPALK